MKNRTWLRVCSTIGLALTAIHGAGQSTYEPYTFITLAGLAGFGNPGSADGTASTARFYYPSGVAVDSAGNVYVADYNNYTIRKGIPSGSVPAPILQPPSVSTGAFSFGITVVPGLAVKIESSTDLSQWQVVGTYVLDGGTNNFTSHTQPQSTQFYRGRIR